MPSGDLVNLLGGSLITTHEPPSSHGICERHTHTQAPYPRPGVLPSSHGVRVMDQGDLGFRGSGVQGFRV